jgi:hypothetical protein
MEETFWGYLDAEGLRLEKEERLRLFRDMMGNQ